MELDRAHPRLVILDYSGACMLLAKPSQAAAIGALIAIHGQREFPVEDDGIEHRLILKFDDVEAPSRTDFIQAARVRLRSREIAERTGMTLTPPAPEHAMAIIEFARKVREIDGAVLCHCQGGISRSPAAALLCLAAWTGPCNEDYCVEYVLAARPCALPHTDLIEFGDELLHRAGKLVEALRRARPY